MLLYQFKLGQLNIQKTSCWHCFHSTSFLPKYKCPHAFMSISIENCIFMKNKTNKFLYTLRTHIQFLRHLMEYFFVEGDGKNLMAPWLRWNFEGLCAIKWINNCGSPLVIKPQRGKGDDGTAEYGVQRYLCLWLYKIKDVGLTLYNKCIDELVSINTCPRHI